MRALDVVCGVCGAKLDELCHRTGSAMMVGRFHRVRVSAAAKAERDRNLAKRQGLR